MREFGKRFIHTGVIVHNKNYKQIVVDEEGRKHEFTPYNGYMNSAKLGDRVKLYYISSPSSGFTIYEVDNSVKLDLTAVREQYFKNYGEKVSIPRIKLID